LRAKIRLAVSEQLHLPRKCSKIDQRTVFLGMTSRRGSDTTFDAVRALTIWLPGLDLSGRGSAKMVNLVSSGCGEIDREHEPFVLHKALLLVALTSRTELGVFQRSNHSRATESLQRNLCTQDPQLAIHLSVSHFKAAQIPPSTPSRRINQLPYSRLRLVILDPCIRLQAQH